MEEITLDPRSDLKEDHHLWADVLALCNRNSNEELKIMMGALRRAECSLWLEDGEVCFSFNRKNLDDYLIKRAKEILKPYKNPLENIFKKIAKKHINLKPENWEEEVPF